jgi:hypothetical protein
VSGWPRWRRSPNRLPGRLCDETSKPTGGTFYDDLNRELQDPAVAADFAANAARIQAIDAGRRAEAGRWEPRRDGETDNPRTALDQLRLDYSQLLLEKEAAETEADCLRVALHRLAREKDALEQQRGSQWIGHADTAVLPRVRSYPAPGLAIDVTQPGDEDDLLIGRPW